MKFLNTYRVLSTILLIQQILTPNVLSCNVLSKVDAISHLNYRGIAFVLTSNRYYFIVKEEDIKKKDIKEFESLGKIPYLGDCCDSALIKDLDNCPNDDDNEHSIVFIKRISNGLTNYISLDINSLFNDDKSYLWSQPKPISTDILLSNANIDYSKPIDAIFHTDNNGEIYFIQGEFYSGIEFHESCPQQRDQIKVYRKRSLSDLNVFGTIDSGYYESNGDTNPILFLTNYQKMQYFRIEIDLNESKEGKLVSLKTTTEPLTSHPIFSRICVPHNPYNWSHLSANELTNNESNGVTLNKWSLIAWISYLTLLSSISTLIHS